MTQPSEPTVSGSSRGRPILTTLLRTTAAVAGLYVAYAFVPIGIFDLWPFLVFAAGAALFALALIGQLRAITIADRPTLRAIEAVGVLVTLINVAFAITYLMIADQHPGAFSQPLDKIGALYFTTTVLSTVGFGDIVAVTDAARIAVMVQMLVDLVLLAAGVRLLAGAVARGRAARES
ncbi:potassium channel family protein [Leifsonia sp. H3M29-4]|uniref:potassium channel family protein n=1 Tax=Salinibacterium metalliresistens TaxID=3031321 RepID=UPI0023DB87ED|nr:potassium channel family protein [Salinibacterium metalliresistens]MDF1479636.1 potassium channel family protein [Salinibacterium metalliresistens]